VPSETWFRLAPIAGGGPQGDSPTNPRVRAMMYEDERAPRRGLLAQQLVFVYRLVGRLLGACIIPAVHTGT
jgi:hypothetical protein